MGLIRTLTKEGLKKTINIIAEIRTANWLLHFSTVNHWNDFKLIEFIHDDTTT